jgi:hypothetical protein
VLAVSTFGALSCAAILGFDSVQYASTDGGGTDADAGPGAASDAGDAKAAPSRMPCQSSKYGQKPVSCAVGIEQCCYLVNSTDPNVCFDPADASCAQTLDGVPIECTEDSHCKEIGRPGADTCCMMIINGTDPQRGACVAMDKCGPPNQHLCNPDTNSSCAPSEACDRTYEFVGTCKSTD